MTDEPSIEGIARRVRAEMAAQRRTQGELAEALGVTVSQVARRVNGEVPFSASHLARTARFLGVSADTLLGDQVGAA